MKKTVYVCDRCEKVITDGDHMMIALEVHTGEDGLLTPVRDDDRVIHFHSECMNSVLQERRELPEQQEEGPAPEADQEKKSGKKKKEVDMGKIKSLYDAHWPTKDIADDLGISVSRAHYYIGKLKRDGLIQ